MTQSQLITARLAERVGPSVVDDVRSIRQQLDAEAGHDIHKLAEKARRVAEEFRRRQAAIGDEESE